MRRKGTVLVSRVTYFTLTLCRNFVIRRSVFFCEPKDLCNGRGLQRSFASLRVCDYFDVAKIDAANKTVTTTKSPKIQKVTNSQDDSAHLESRDA